MSRSFFIGMLSGMLVTAVPLVVVLVVALGSTACTNNIH
jgi:hypothetical protein